jgi:hypothetical protein
MILEGIVTTQNVDGSWNIAPMGPRVTDRMDRFLLRPFQTSVTYANLKRHGEGVLHVVDDVFLLAQAATKHWRETPELLPGPTEGTRILAAACRWYAFRVDDLDDSQERTAIQVGVFDRGTLRECFGFNRAKHAVLEAAILATRVHLIPAEEIQRQIDLLTYAVEKTGGPREQAAFDLVREAIALTQANP